MKTLVTGAGGFLGRHVVAQLLERGDEVRGIARGDYPELAEQGVEMLRVDVRDRDAVVAACQGVDVVFHTAAVPGIWGSWEHYHGINTVGTESVLAGCRAHGVERLVYTSSPSVTFDGDHQCGIGPEAPYASRWLCHYPHTKALAEQQVLAANGTEGLWTCALRPHLIWGPGDPHLIPRLIARRRAGRLRRVGDGTNLIDMVYVDNAAAAHLQAAEALGPERAASGKAYFLTQGEPVNCWDWIDELLALAGLEPVRGAVSVAMASRVGAVCEAVYRTLGVKAEPPMTRFLALQLGKSHYFDISAAQRDFGYQPAVSTTEGMRRVGAWLDSLPRN
ncbi:MAG: NAD-dependent epimerase/dehydratase family protein [Planctomycetales bacterium]|nr:NAD-dependent epimerase/dehydratase family protein [Planctomycetales bacterium]